MIKTATIDRHRAGSRSQTEKPRGAGAGQSVPGRCERDHEAGEDDQSTGKLRDDDVDAENQEDSGDRQDRDRGKPPAITLLGKIDLIHPREIGAERI